MATQSSLCTSARGNYNFQIGAMTAGSLCFNGDIAEIQVFNRALGSVDVTSVNEILAATYGVTGGVAARMLVWGANANGQTNVPATLTNC